MSSRVAGLLALPDAEPVPDGLTVTTARATAPADVAIAGVTWPGTDLTPELDVYLRQRSGRTWTGWQSLEVSSLEACAGENDGTEPVAVLDASGIEVAPVGPSGTVRAYPASRAGGFGTPATAGTGCTGYDLVAVRDDEVVLYPGNGMGGFAALRTLGALSAGATGAR